MNLIELSSKWLQKTDYSKSIQVRTKDVIYKFKKHLESSPDSIFEKIGSKEDLLAVVEDIYNLLVELLNVYLDGNIMGSIDIAHTLLMKVPLSTIDAQTNFYRARSNETGFLYKNEEMFHIPYQLRYKITNQRYSVSGLPCLYLASSSYLCWEELGRPDFQKCNYCILRNLNPLAVFDLRIPEEIESVEDVVRVCLALACSLKSQKDHTFKLEYIIPQCLLYSITSDRHYSHDGIGICYYSVQFLYQETSTFIIDFDIKEIVSRFCNVVIPAQSPRKTGVSPLLRNMFVQSPSMSLMYRYLINTPSPKYVSTIDGYGNSQFGLLEDYLINSIEMVQHATLNTIE